MSFIVTIVHVGVSLFLMLTVLLQAGKGGGMGATFGGGSSQGSVFGGSGAGNFLSKLTTASAAIFMLTSMTLAYLASTTGADPLERVSADARKSAAEKKRLDQQAQDLSNANQPDLPETEDEGSLDDVEPESSDPMTTEDVGAESEDGESDTADTETAPAIEAAPEAAAKKIPEAAAVKPAAEAVVAKPVPAPAKPVVAKPVAVPAKPVAVPAKPVAAPAPVAEPAPAPAN